VLGKLRRPQAVPAIPTETVEASQKAPYRHVTSVSAPDLTPAVWPHRCEYGNSPQVREADGVPAEPVIRTSAVAGPHLGQGRVVHAARLLGHARDDLFGRCRGRQAGRVGVWVEHGAPKREDKIAAIGVRLRRWVSFHGISVNVEPDLEHFAGIVPCGVTDHGVTSLVGLGLPVSMAEADAALKASFERVFGATQAAAPPI